MERHDGQGRRRRRWVWVGLVDKTGAVILLTLACTCTQHPVHPRNKARPDRTVQIRNPEQGDTKRNGVEPYRAHLPLDLTATPWAPPPTSLLPCKRKKEKIKLSSRLPHPTRPVPWFLLQGSAQAGRWRVDSHRAPTRPPIRRREKISPKETTEESDASHCLRTVNNNYLLEYKEQ